MINNTGSSDETSGFINVGVSVVVANEKGLEEIGSCLVEMPKVKYKAKDKKKVASKSTTKKTKETGVER